MCVCVCVCVCVFAREGVRVCVIWCENWNLEGIRRASMCRRAAVLMSVYLGIN